VEIRQKGRQGQGTSRRQVGQVEDRETDVDSRQRLRDGQEIGRRQTDRGEAGRQAGRDFRENEEMVEVGKQVAMAQKCRLCPQFRIHCV